MKKILLLSMALATTLSFFSCKDEIDKSYKGSEVIDRLSRPAFRTDNNTGKGSNDPYNSVITDHNTANLFWFLVNDAVGYEIMWTYPHAYVANGDDAWEETVDHVDGKSLEGHIVIADPDKYNIIIKNLQYQSSYRFCIRALHSFDKTGYQLWRGEANVYDVLDTPDANWKNDPKNSDWYGRGNLREWADYFQMETDGRTWVPFVIQVSDITKTSMRITLNRNISKYSDTDKATYREHWNFLDEEENILKVDYLTIVPNAGTPNATVPAAFQKYQIPESAWDENGIAVIEVNGLSENSCYNIDAWDNSIPLAIDAVYNTTMKRTKGDAAPPIYIKHQVWANDTLGTDPATWNIYDISEYNACKIDKVLDDYCASSVTAENQVFYLEGGKTYFISSNVQVYKGFTLATNPEDLAAGKGRAKFYLSGMTQTGNSVNSCNFMLGRQPAAGENGSITLDIDSVRFMDLDVNVPRAGNYGTAQEGKANACGNYFMNMYSNGMGINVTTLEWHRCSFQGLIRGFFRIQGSNDFYIQHIRMIDCEHYNSGYYDAKLGGYWYIFGDHNGKPKSNILQDVEVSGCVFYDCQKGGLITDQNRNLTWDESVRWKINVHHNTFVNFCTTNKQVIMNSRYNPGGSYLAFHDNVIINTKDEADKNRKFEGGGWDTRNIQGGDGSGIVTFDIYNNWTTNDPYLSNGQPFAASAFNATSNAPGKFIKGGQGIYPAGTDELAVKVDESLKATDLMVSPNPKYYIGETPKGTDHHTDNGIEGLYYKQTTEVLNSAIFKSGAGAAKLRNGKK